MSNDFFGWWRVNVEFCVHGGSHWKNVQSLRGASEARAKDGSMVQLSDDRVTDALALRLWDLGKRFYESPTRGLADNRKFVDSVGWTTICELLACENDTRPLARLARTAHVMRLVRRCHQQLDDAEVVLFPSGEEHRATLATSIEATGEAKPPVWKQEIAVARRERLENLIAWRKAQGATTYDHEETVELLTLLQYNVREFKMSGRHGGGNSDGLLNDEVLEMRTAIGWLTENSGLTEPVIVPEWFVPSYEVDAKRKKRHDADVNIINQTESGQLSADDVVRQATVWSDLHHPNIAKFFGACHVGKNRMLLYENTIEIYPFTSEEWWNTWRSCALVLFYLLERNMAFATFSRDRIRVAHSQNKTVVLGTDVITLDQGNDEDGSEWPLPSYFMANVTSLANMIQESIQRVAEGRKSRLLNGLCSACLSETQSREDVLQALKSIASESDENPEINLDDHPVLSGLDRPVADVVAVINHSESMRFVDVFSNMARDQETHGLSPNRTHVYDGLVYAFGQMQTLAPPLPLPLLQALQRVVNRYYRTVVQNNPIFLLWGNNDDNDLWAQRVENEDFEMLRDVANLCAIMPSVPAGVKADKVLRHWRAKFCSNRCQHRGSTSDGNGDAGNVQVNAQAASVARFELSKRSRYFGDGSDLPLEKTKLEAASEVPRWFIPPYEVEIRKKLGKGGFATVCEGKWFNTDVIVKRVNCNGANSTSLEAFKREADIWFLLTHPNVVKLYGACHLEGEQFFVCEYASQGTIMGFVNRKKDEESNKYVHNDQDRAKTAWRCLYDAALGLQYLHERGITHGDLKGDNILVGVDGRARLTDFGLSAAGGTDAKAITAAAHWKAPEVLLEEIPTSASDVYSFAMCIIEVRTDEIPWGGLNPVAVSFHVKKKTLPPQPKCFTDAEWDLVERMTCFNPQERLAMPVVAERLHEFVKQYN